MDRHMSDTKGLSQRRRYRLRPTRFEAGWGVDRLLPFWQRYADFVDAAHRSLGRDMTDIEELRLFTNFLRVRMDLDPIPDTGIFRDKKTSHLKRKSG